MSVYGGDSWAPAAQCRKRRVDDLLIGGVEPSAYKKLPNGKFACLICPHNPVLDTPITLSMHVGGSRHRAAEWRRKDRELAHKVSKRSNSAAVSSIEQRKAASKPLVERARKAAAYEVFRGEVARCDEVKGDLGRQCGEGCGGDDNLAETRAIYEGVRGEVHPLYYQERELKFTAAGWKRDCGGRWFKDENVEFDSDEEDPNVVLNGTA